MQITIITPDKTIFEGEVSSAKFPGSKGAFEVLKDHAALISTLDEGNIQLRTEKNEVLTYKIDTGVVEVLQNNLTVLVESVLE